jgi:hypothetical protein
MTNAPPDDPSRMPPVVELRQYTLRPGRREELVELFERELLEPQEDAGMQVLGTFRDLDRPDRFVWLRGFPDITARAEALTAFYGGPVWGRHRDAANATMLDSDDVLLLRPVDGTPSTTAADGGETSLLTAELLLLRRPVDAAFRSRYTGEVEPLLEQAGSRRLALLETELAANTFPRLPVREGEHAVVRLARSGDAAPVHERLEQVSRRLRGDLAAPPQLLRLEPNRRSRLR